MPEGTARSDSLDTDFEQPFGFFRAALDAGVRGRGEARIGALRSRNRQDSKETPDGLV